MKKILLFIFLFTPFSKAEKSFKISNHNYQTNIKEIIFPSSTIKLIKDSYQSMQNFDNNLKLILKACRESRLKLSKDNLNCPNPLETHDYQNILRQRENIEIKKHELQKTYSRLKKSIHESEKRIKSPLSKQSQNLKNEWDLIIQDTINKPLESYNDFIKAEWALDILKLTSEETHSQNKTDQITEKEKEKELKEFYKKNILKFKKSPTSFKSPKFISPKKNKPSTTQVLNFNGFKFKFNEWALTFDDGPRAFTTNQILNTLQSYNTPATFFWLASNAKKKINKSVIQKAKLLRMGLANHSYSHENLSKKNTDFYHQIVESKYELETQYGKKINYFRLPYGAGLKNTKVNLSIASQKMNHFMWNVDSLDWKDPLPESILNRIQIQMEIQGKGIILLHDIHQKTADTTKLLMNYFIEHPQLRIKSLSRLTQDLGGLPVTEKGFYTPQNIEKFPHKRLIIASSLNIRSSPFVSSQTLCGRFFQAKEVFVIGKDASTGWYLVDTQYDRSPWPCSIVGYIHHSTKFSIRLAN